MGLFQNVVWIAVLYLLVMNGIGFAVFGIDKSKAKHHAWRIPEKVLFLVSLLGGSIGTWAGMYCFRHKTRHWYFVVGMPAILLIQILVGLGGFFKLFG
jgi:uncharacterized membrane protein YsdA (DUF1294 family)